MDTILNYIKTNKPKMIFLGILVLTFFILLSADHTIVIEQEATSNQQIASEQKSSDITAEETKIEKSDVHVFIHPQCGHCHKELAWFKDINIEKKFPHINLVIHDITTPGKGDLMQFYGKSFGIESRYLGTPLLVYGDQYVMGFGSAKTTGQDILKLLDPNKDDKTAPSSVSFKGEKEELKESITLPIFGEVSLVKTSIPLLAIILGTVDGFNPCAMWVLVFLISIIAELNDRRKIYTLIGTFLMASGILYFLFMTAWLNLFLFVGYVKAITLAIGLSALYFGFTSIYDYIKSGGQAECHVDFQSQSKTKSKIKTLVSAPLTIATFSGIVLLAFAVNSIEFVCSSALPAIFTQVLTLADISMFSYYMYILLYVLFFMIDDLIIFMFAAFAIEKFAGDKYAGYCKVIGGVILIALGIFMTFFPNLLR